jgi:two-component system phosphate regulon sensor histidine kinase PhoR
VSPFWLIPLLLVLAGLTAAWLRARRRLQAADDRLNKLAAQLEASAEHRRDLTALQLLSEVAYNTLVLVNQDRTVVYMNEAACSLFGVTHPAETAGRTLLGISGNAELDDYLRQALETGEQFTTQIKLKKGAYRGRTLRGQFGGQYYVALTLEDVSELQRLDRARRDMVANISHELRTPITSIRLLVDTLLRAEGIPPEGARLLNKVAGETDTLQQMAQELLDLAMIESGRAEFLLVPVDLGEIIADAVEHLAQQAQRKGISIEGQAPPNLYVLADAQQVARVFNNLIHNAIKFTPRDGLIDIAVDLQGDFVQIVVTDTGPGIAGEERERVFERFYQSDRARRSGGTGLGLAIAKHIVQAHGGRIWAEEPPHSHGARLCFTLPLADE